MTEIIGEIDTSIINNKLDRTISQMLADAKEYNDDKLHTIKPIFDSKREIEHLNIPDSIILKLLYMKND